MTYFQERMNQLGATQAEYFGLFEESTQGDIDIYFLGLDGEPVYVPRSGGKDGKQEKYKVIRLHPSRVQGDNKYIRPRSNSSMQSAYCWFPPQLIDRYHRKAPIDTLYITEGVFKGFAGAKHGLDIVGLQGIHNYSITIKDDVGNIDVRRLDPEVQAIIQDCKVKNVVYLLDADCRDISIDEENENKDLYTRPNSFFTAVKGIRELLKQFNVDTYFAHLKGEAKGLDDMYLANKYKGEFITEQLQSLQSTEVAEYLNITTLGLTKIKDYFKISTPEGFYAFHEEKLEYRPFVFKRTKYRFNLEEEKLEVLRAKEADMYIRVGDDYIKRVQKPSRYGGTVPVFTKVLKSTIADDWKETIPNIFKMIEKYEGFVVVPSHTNYEPIINKAWINEYKPFLHEPVPGSCDTSLDFIKHIFGESTVEWQGQKVPQWQFGLDYIQLLYQRPKEILLVLILVSEENQTGKGTFKNWLRYIFGENSTEVTIDELDDSFNEAYATKSLVFIDEALIDRGATKERLKYLSTNDTIKINPKGLKRYEVDFFGKFVLLSNNEENCIPITREDDRFWIHKVHKPTKQNVYLFDELRDEVPAFLNFLKIRKMVCPIKQTRAWFPHAILDTPARERMIQFNRTFIEKAIIECVREIFVAMMCSTGLDDGQKVCDIEQIALDRKVFVEFLKENNYRNWTPHQITDTLRKKFGITPRPNGTFKHPVLTRQIGLEDTEEFRLEFKKSINVHYVFQRELFFTADELDLYKGLKKNVKVQNVPF